MSWLNPAAAWWLLLVPALIVLYMLRPRSLRRQVSSLRLWQKLPRVDRPRARLRRPPLSLLLLLQALLLLAGAFALMQPAISAPAGRHLVIMLDASGSMWAADGGQSRFERAIAEAGKLASEMTTEDQATLLRVSSSTETACAECTRAALERALGELQPGVARADWSAALGVASGLARRYEVGSTDVYIVSDGAFDAPEGYDLSASLHFIGVGSEVDNRAVTVLSARRPPDGSPGYVAYARVENYGDTQVTVNVSALADTVPLSDRRIDLPAGHHADLVWQVRPGTARFTVSLTPSDALPADDRAVIFLPSEGQNKVVVSASDPDLYGRAIEGIPGMAPVGELAEGDGLAAFTIIEGEVPDQLPAGSLLLVNPSGDLLTVKGELTGLRPVSLDPNHPLLAGIDLRALIVEKAQSIETPDWLDPLVESGSGPLVLAGEREGRRIAVLAFDPRDSNLPKLAAFPLLMANLADWLYPLAAAQAILPGEPVSFAPGSTVTTPGGRTIEVGPSGVFAATDEAGIYRVSRGGESELAFSVNMADEAESLAAPRPHPELERESPQRVERLMQQSLWSPLALLALLLVGGEWLYYCWKRGQL
jgi:hypothetical protein